MRKSLLIFQMLLVLIGTNANAQTEGEVIVYPPLIQTDWVDISIAPTDFNPFNYYTPVNYSPGSVAMAMGTVMKHWEWPKTGVGSHTYTDYGTNATGTHSVDFSGAFYNYDLLADNYYAPNAGTTPATEAELQEVGKLMYHCAVSVDANFEGWKTTSNINRIPEALANHFRYGSHYEEPQSYTAFWSTLERNIQNGQPVILALDEYGKGQVAVVVDGYKLENGKEYYHIVTNTFVPEAYLNTGWYALTDDPYVTSRVGVVGAVLDITPVPEISEIVKSEVESEYILKCRLADYAYYSVFYVEQQVNGGEWSYIDFGRQIWSGDIENGVNISIPEGGAYNFRVSASGVMGAKSEEKSIVVKDNIIALEFDGDDSFFVYDNSSNDMDISDEWTIETWVNIKSHVAGTYPVILDRQTVFSLYVISDTDADYALRFASRSSTGGTIAYVSSERGSLNMNFGQWHHVAISRSLGITSLFIDGQLADSSNETGFALTPTTKALNIGARYWGGYQRYMEGKLDGIAISKEGKYTSNFAPDITENYPIDANTVLALNIDEGTGIDLTDETNNFAIVKLRVPYNNPNWVFEKHQTSLGKTLSEKNIDPLTNRLKIFPTVASEVINIESSIDEDALIKVYNYVGQTVKVSNVELSKNNISTIDISELSNGIYIVKIESANSNLTERIIVRK
ncbi:MAG: C10 family peptidase [Bacteroidota bacterium]